MSSRRAVRAIVVALLFAGVVSWVQPVESAAYAQASDLRLTSSYSIVVQGETDIVQGEESDNDFYEIRILTYTLPYDVSRVYSRIPQSAEELFVVTSAGEVNSTSYGFETSGVNAGDFYVDVPSIHPRTAHFLNTTDDATEFAVPDSEFTNTSYSSGALRLTAGNDSGEFVSGRMLPPLAERIASATMTFDGNSSSNITSFLSNDGGNSWVGCQNASAVNFTTMGTALKVKFDLDGNVSAGYEPFVSSFSLNATYVLNFTIFTVHVSYVWTEDFTGGRASLDFSEAVDFASDGSFVLMLYLVPGYEIESSGLGLNLDSSGNQSSYPDKLLYYSMTLSADELQSFAVVLVAPQKSGNLLYYLGAIALLVGLGLAYLYSKRSKSKTEIEPSESLDLNETEQAGASGGAISDGDESRRKELVSRKKELLAEIDKTKSEIESSAGSSEDQKARLSTLKKEYKALRNELNRVSKRTMAVVSSQAPEAGGSVQPSASEYQSLLAMIARIDDDFEKGRLPESAYQSLRKEYLSKAAEVRASTGRKESPLDEEKNKLMEAIAALDEEREKGEVDEKVYAELKSSYRRRLVELIKKSESGRQGDLIE